MHKHSEQMRFLMPFKDQFLNDCFYVTGNMCWALVDVDADSPVNCKVQPELEEGEFIQTFLLPLDNLYESLLVKIGPACCQTFVA